MAAKSRGGRRTAAGASAAERGSRSHRPLAHADIPPPVDIDTGTAHVEISRDDDAAWTLYVNNVPSSPFYHGNPARLDFGYLAQMQAAVSHWWQATPHAADRLWCSHIGGAACALPRALIAAHPASRHVVAEIDAALIAYVRQHFPLPKSPALKIRAVDGLAFLSQLPPASQDVIVRDAFAGALTPPHLSDRNFYAVAATQLRPGGLLALNIAGASLANLRLECGHLLAEFPHAVLTGEAAVLAGRAAGNITAFASAEPLTPAFQQTVYRASPQPVTVWDTAAARQFCR